MLPQVLEHQEPQFIQFLQVELAPVFAQESLRPLLALEPTEALFLRQPIFLSALQMMLE